LIGLIKSLDAARERIERCATMGKLYANIGRGG
jgi:hypothetical protein